MTRSSNQAWSRAAALVCLVIGGCAADSNADTGEVTRPVQCAPNVPAACLCPNGTSGSQTCSAEGMPVGTCDCGVAAGGAGASGAAGSASAAAGMSAPPMAGMGGIATQPNAGSGGRGTGSSGMMAGAGGMTGMNAGNGGAQAAGNGGSAGSMATGGDVPDGAHCAPVAMWDPAWVAFEEEVLVLVNENRAMGWNCDSEGQFPAAEPLTMNPFLRCAARLHSQDMGARDFFDHTNPDGDGPSQRIDAAGYMGGTWGENIAMGQQTPAQVVAGWMDSDGHCANIMRAEFTEIGVGFARGASQRDLYWTQTFGAPCSGRWCM